MNIFHYVIHSYDTTYLDDIIQQNLPHLLSKLLMHVLIHNYLLLDFSASRYVFYFFSAGRVRVV